MLAAPRASWRMLEGIGWRSPGLKALCVGSALGPGLAEHLAACAATPFEAFGRAEAGVWSVVQPAGTSARAVLGSPLPGAQLHVISGGRLAPPSVQGQLCIGGVGVVESPA